MENEVFSEKEYYRQKIIEMVGRIDNIEKGELLYKIVSIVEILPISECHRIFDYLSELYLS